MRRLSSMRIYTIGVSYDRTVTLHNLDGKEVGGGPLHVREVKTVLAPAGPAGEALAVMLVKQELRNYTDVIFHTIGTAAAPDFLIEVSTR